MAKKIETGCMAIFVKGASGSKFLNTGKIVTVGKFIGEKIGFAGTMWEVDQPIVYSTGESFLFAPEFSLERIDDDSIQKRIMISKSITA